MYMFKYCCDECETEWYSAAQTYDSKEDVKEYYNAHKFTALICPFCKRDDLYLDSVVKVNDTGMDVVYE